jgi:hypothetical protein
MGLQPAAILVNYVYTVLSKLHNSLGGLVYHLYFRVRPANQPTITRVVSMNKTLKQLITLSMLSSGLFPGACSSTYSPMKMEQFRTVGI